MALTRAVRTSTGGRLGQRAPHVDLHRLGGGAADLGGELAEAIGSELGDGGVDALLEAGRGLRPQTEARTSG
jgi:hypothetical protein